MVKSSMITNKGKNAAKDDFDIKIELLKRSYPEKKIVIISTENNIDELKTKHGEYATILPLNSANIIDYFK